MATITSAPLMQCDRCKNYFKQDSYHSRLTVKGGFTKIDAKHGTTITVRDLCSTCEQSLIAWLDEPTNTQPMDMEE